MSHRVAVLAPSYNNAATLPAVLDAIRAHTPDVIVIDDGSTDSTPEILKHHPDLVVISHPHNLGKAAAMRTGFARASQLGFTHCLTIDTDGQHDPADIPKLIDLSQQHPDALILGTRDTSIRGYPRRNRLGRWASNVLIWLHSGLRVRDSQCGLRVYPLAVTRLPTRATRYGYETEVLVRCGWAHVPVVESTIWCVYEIRTGRVSHFKPLADSVRATGMHARLLARSLMAWRTERLGRADDRSTTGTIVERLLRWFSPMRAWRAIHADAAERKRFAAALSLGVLIANLPLYGVQTFLSLALAKRFGLHPLAVVAGSHLSTPPVGPMLVVAAIATGHLILHGRPASLAEFDPTRIGYLELLRRVAIEWTLGSIVCGLSLALITFFTVQLMLRLRFPAHRT
jgi:uncharacterized protein (DUF2062 family)